MIKKHVPINNHYKIISNQITADAGYVVHTYSNTGPMNL